MWNELTEEVWKYAGVNGYACGTSFLYLKAFWQQHRFPEDQDLGSDNSIIYPARDRHQTATFDGSRQIVARIHKHQSNFKDLKGYKYVQMQLSALPSGFPKS